MSLPRDFKIGEKVQIQFRDVGETYWGDGAVCDSVKDAREKIELETAAGEYRIIRFSPVLLLKPSKGMVASIGGVEHVEESTKHADAKDKVVI